MSRSREHKESKNLSRLSVPVLPEILVTPPDSPVNNVLVLDESNVRLNLLRRSKSFVELTQPKAVDGLLQVPEAAFLDMKEPIPPRTKIWIPMLDIVPQLCESYKEPWQRDDVALQMMRWRSLVSRL